MRKYNDEKWSYLWYPHFPAGLQEVLHISLTLGHAELGLERERDDVKNRKDEGGFRQHKQSETYHGRRGNVDAGN